MADRVTGATLWANLHLLFWLSLVPFLTGWMSENDFPPVPTATYGIVLLAAAIAYYILQLTFVYVVVALVWLVPDRRVERVVTTRQDGTPDRDSR